MEEHHGRCLVRELWKGQETTRQEPQCQGVKQVLDDYNIYEGTRMSGKYLTMCNR